MTTPNVHPLYILGTSGHSREMEEIIRAIDPESARWSEIVRVELDAEASLDGSNGDIEVVLGMGDPRLRWAAMERWGNRASWPTLVHPRAEIGRRVLLEHGVNIAPGCIVTVDVSVNAGTMVNTGSVLSHDVRIGRACLINPHATISGNVVIGDRVLVGAGAVVMEGRHLGDGAVVGAGAVVTKDVPPGICVVGVPARRIQISEISSRQDRYLSKPVRQGK